MAAPGKRDPAVVSLHEHQARAQLGIGARRGSEVDGGVEERVSEPSPKRIERVLDTALTTRETSDFFLELVLASLGQLGESGRDERPARLNAACVASATARNQ